MYQWGLLNFLLNIDMDSAILLFCFLLSSFTHFHFSLIFLLFAPSPFISVSWLSITCSLMVWFVVTESSVTKEAKWNGSESGTVLSVMNYAGRVEGSGGGPLFWLHSTAQTGTSGSTLISPAVSHHMESMNWDTLLHTLTLTMHTRVPEDNLIVIQ